MEGKKIKLGDKVEGIVNVENRVLKIVIEVNEDNEDEWELFKKLCRKNNSDASKEVRKFIREYIKKHKEEK
ncbi:MAG TPA: hypothetical protein EYP03_00010 [Aquificae bacterium]|nr:hypothetical protein [Aquificota bacterium]